MDCNDAKAKIDLYLDDRLDDAEKQRLIWHASSCPECKKALDDAIRVKQALAGLKEVEPPKGLTASAIKKAKRHFVPAWVYPAAAAAAAVALLLIFSPSLLPRMNGTADSEQKLMYSAASEEMAEASSTEDNSISMDVAPEDGLEESAMLPQCVAGEAASEVRTSDTGAGAYATTCTFASEADFIEEMRSEGLVYYCRPEALPKGSALMQIEVSNYSVRWVYSFGEDSAQTLVYEWYRVWTADDIADWGETTQLLSDNLAHSYTHSGDCFWSSESRFDENGEMEATDGMVIHAYWAQEGVAFHAELPSAFTDQDILATCTMEIVPLE